MITMKKIFLLMAMTCILNGIIAQENKTNVLNTNLKLKNLDGKEINIDDFISEGQITIISFWATWCSPCKKELDNLNELFEEWTENYGVKIIAVSIDNARNSFKVKPYVNGKKWDFSVLLDVNGDTKRTFNYSTIPYSVLIDQKGNIVHSRAGYVEGDEYALEEEIKKLLNN
jgi:cytochrome c biogenesis protein CcmG, thiol:disulfide interchange protein DsbE